MGVEWFSLALSYLQVSLDSDPTAGYLMNPDTGRIVHYEDERASSSRFYLLGIPFDSEKLTC